jgi:hypothetical protein
MIYLQKGVERAASLAIQAHRDFNDEISTIGQPKGHDSRFPTPVLPCSLSTDDHAPYPPLLPRNQTQPLPHTPHAPSDPETDVPGHSSPRAATDSPPLTSVRDGLFARHCMTSASPAPCAVASCPLTDGPEARHHSDTTILNVVQGRESQDIRCVVR